MRDEMRWAGQNLHSLLHSDESECNLQTNGSELKYGYKLYRWKALIIGNQFCWTGM